MLATLERQPHDDTDTNANFAAVTLPVQHALVGQSVDSTLEAFNANIRLMQECAVGEAVSIELSSIVEGLLLNNIATDAIADFSAKPLNERGHSFKSLNDIINDDLTSFIYEHAPEVAQVSDFVLEFEGARGTLELRFKPRFCFAYGTVSDNYKSHPLYFAIRQLPHHLANAVGATNEEDMLAMAESQIEDYLKIIDKNALKGRLEELRIDIDAIYAEDESALDKDQLNDKYTGVVEFYEDDLFHRLVDSLDFCINYKPKAAMKLNELHDWVSNRIAEYHLFADPVSIQLLDDINTLQHTNATFDGFEMQGDDPLMNMLCFLSSTQSEMEDVICTEIEDLGNQAWNNGFEAYFLCDMTQPEWFLAIKQYASVWLIAERYLSIDY